MKNSRPLSFLSFEAVLVRLCSAWLLIQLDAFLVFKSTLTSLMVHPTTFFTLVFLARCLTSQGFTTCPTYHSTKSDDPRYSAQRATWAGPWCATPAPKVILLLLSAAPLRILLRQGWHPNCRGALCDVRTRESISHVLRDAIAHYGRIDVIANCSGYGVIGACEDQDEQEIRNRFEANFMGTLNIIQLSLPYSREMGAGRYLIFSSTAGALGVPGLDLTVRLSMP